MLNSNPLKEKLTAGKTVMGTWMVTPSPILADILGSSGLDFVIADMEHGPISFETAQQMVIAAESRGCSPLVRVGGVLQEEILRGLDIGSHGIHVPNVSTLDDVNNMIKYSKYPPLGERGFSPFTRAGNYQKENGPDLIKKANENTLNVIHIEGKDAVDNIDTILENESIDIYYLGLFDLSKSLGIPGQVNDPQVLNLVETLTKKIRDKGRWVGSISTDEASTRRLADSGVQYITWSVDCEVIRESYEKISKILG